MINDNSQTDLPKKLLASQIMIAALLMQNIIVKSSSKNLSPQPLEKTIEDIIKMINEIEKKL